MEDVLGYEGRKVVVTGAASGMGAATAGLLTSLPVLCFALAGALLGGACVSAD